MNVKITSKDSRKKALKKLILAVEEGQEDVAIEILEGYPDLIHEQDDIGRTVLHDAAQLGLPKLIHYILKCGINPSLPIKKHATPLHFCAYGGFNRCDTDDEKRVISMGILLAAGANVNAVDTHGTTPLAEMARHANLAGFVMLLAHGANFLIKCDSEWTPLITAVNNLQIDTKLNRKIFAIQNHNLACIIAILRDLESRGVASLSEYVAPAVRPSK